MMISIMTMIRGWILDSFTLLTPVLLTASSSCLTLVTSCVNPFHLGSPHTNLCQDKKIEIASYITLFGRDRDHNHVTLLHLASHHTNVRQDKFVLSRLSLPKTYVYQKNDEKDYFPLTWFPVCLRSHYKTNHWSRYKDKKGRQKTKHDVYKNTKSGRKKHNENAERQTRPEK